MDYQGKMFLTIKETAQLTGISQYYLRNGCRSGSVPHIMSGSRFLINVPMLLDSMNRESKGQRTAEAS